MVNHMSANGSARHLILAIHVLVTNLLVVQLRAAPSVGNAERFFAPFMVDVSFMVDVIPTATEQLRRVAVDAVAAADVAAAKSSATDTSPTATSKLLITAPALDARRAKQANPLLEPELLNLNHSQNHTQIQRRSSKPERPSEFIASGLFQFSLSAVNCERLA